MTSETATLFPPSSIFTAFKREKSLKELLTSSKYRPQNVKETNIQRVADNKCERCGSCHLCKQGFLVEGKTITSYESTKTFYVNDYVNCNTTHIIYMVLDQICKKSYIGYTIDAAKDRWSNHKSHIKKLRNTCSLTSHMVDTKNTIHELNRKTQKLYDLDLQKHLKFQIIEKVNIEEGWSKDKIKEVMMSREGYWQTQLSTKKDQGGLNARDSRTEAQKLRFSQQ